MQTTSHFVWIWIRSELFSDLYVKLYKYLKDNWLENILTFQNILSLHITLYYFPKDLENLEELEIKNLINSIDNDLNIKESWFRYFERNNEKIIWYIYWNSPIDLKKIFLEFHKIFNKIEVFENNLDFVPHITFFRIKDSEKYELNKGNIEKIINEELINMKNINLFNWKINLYKVSSNFPWEIQIKFD